jgi:hypothetical protein
VLALAAAAVVAGMKGYTAIAGWVRDVPSPVLADLYSRAGASPAGPPSKATPWRVTTDADAEVFDATVGRWLMSSQAGGQFVLPVKENRKALFDALDALPWQQVPVAHTETDRGHGRITTRTIQVMPAPADQPFPHVSQALLIERYVSDLAGNPVPAVAAPWRRQPLRRSGQPRPRGQIPGQNPGQDPES